MRKTIREEVFGSGQKNSDQIFKIQNILNKPLPNIQDPWKQQFKNKFSKNPEQNIKIQNILYYFRNPTVKKLT